jgi:hypothetical protein
MEPTLPAGHTFDIARARKGCQPGPWSV